MFHCIKPFSGTALSMLPVTESAYENEAFRGETAKRERDKVKI